MLAIAVAFLACAQAEERATEAREAVERALEAQDRRGALRAIEAYLEVAPGSPESSLEAAALLVRAGEAGQAVWLLEESRSRFPDRSDLALALARVALLVGDASRAREAAAAVSRESEHHVAALLAQSEAEVALGDLPAALAVLEEAQGLHPDRPETRIATVALLAGRRRFDEAAAAGAEARTALDPEDDGELLAQLDLLLARIEAETDRPGEALGRVEGLLEARPDDVRAWSVLTALLFRLDRGEESLGRLTEAAAAAPEEPTLALLVADASLRLGRIDDAEAEMRRYAALSGTPASLSALAKLQAQLGRLTDAKETLTEAASRFPEEPMLRYALGDVLLGLDDSSGAAAELARLRELGSLQNYSRLLEARLDLARGESGKARRRLERLAPELDQPATHFWLGRALESQGEVEGALRRYGQATRLDPTWVPPFEALVELAAESRRWEAVVRPAQALVRLRPDAVDAWIALVTAELELGRNEEGLRISEQARQRFPENPKVRLLLARALRDTGKQREALAELTESARGTPADAPVSAERLRLLGSLGRLEAALEEARELVRRDPGSSVLHAVLAELLFARGDSEEGARMVDRALQLAPDDTRSLANRCRYRAATADWRGAERDCTRVLARRPEDAESRALFAFTLAAQGRRSDAIREYERAAADDPDSFFVRNNLAVLLAEAERIDDAIQVAQQAFALAPENPDVKETLGWIYFRKGLRERGLGFLEEAHAAAPGLASARLHLGLAYAELDRPAKARPLLAQLAENPETQPELRRQAEKALAALD